MSVRAAIVDDEPLARGLIRGLLARDPEVEVVGEWSGAEAVAGIERERPEILFLDIQMPELDGFGVLERVGFHTVPAVVFVTAYDRYSLRAFEVAALDYLLKPFDDARFFAALLRAKERARNRRREVWARCFLVRLHDRVLFVHADQIDWIQAADYCVALHVGAKKHLLRETMKSIESQLDPDRFARIHRTAIVNLERVRELNRLDRGEGMLVLSTGARLRLSRTYRDEFERRLTRRR